MTNFFWKNASLLSLGTHLPEEETTSLEIERRLAPAYRRLGLVEGRLELMTGIRARRHFPEGVLPSGIAARAAEDCLARVDWDRKRVGCLIHSAVCRDYVEPATAAVVHHRLGLSEDCLLFDLSDACLSWLNGLALAATLVESGRVESALVVSGEDARAVVASTVARLNADMTLTRRSLKPALATLTLGSGGTAALVAPASEGGLRLVGAAFSAATEFFGLCRSQDAAEMFTQSDRMLVEGVALAARTWRLARDRLGWEPGDIAHYFTHQVGSAHRRLLLEKLELDGKRDFTTFESLGNVGSASLGLTLALGMDRMRPGEKAMLMGIGSGLVCGMLGVIR